MPSSPIETYRRQIQKELQAGNATEHTHRTALKLLIEALVPGVTATNEPKRAACGAPDYVVSQKSPHGPVTLGYIEAKDAGKNLDEVERDEQLNRYRTALPNLILTDYLEFRWYVGGNHRQTARLARVSNGKRLASEPDGAKAVTELLKAFLSQTAEPISDPKTLALRMARLTHFIRDMIVAAFSGTGLPPVEGHGQRGGGTGVPPVEGHGQNSGGTGVPPVEGHDQDAHATTIISRNAYAPASATLRDLHQAFEKALIPDLPIPQFADMFAQTLAYGLFAARVNHHGSRGSFRRLGAASEIPKTNPFLRRLLDIITGTALDDEPYVGFVDDLAQLLADTDMEAVLADFGKRTVRQDPVVHFYETFLAAYDPKLRETRGVYYTPEPVVSYLVRSVDYLLKTRFGCAHALADTARIDYETSGTGVPPVEGHGQNSGGTSVPPVEGRGQDAHATKRATSPRVLILDPACGTGTFLYAVIDHIREQFKQQGNAGM